MPEGLYNLSQAVLYLAMAPKSNTAKTAYFSALEDVKRRGSLGVPLHLRNAPTALARELGHGAGYKYPHDYPEHYVEQAYLPAPLVGRTYVKPSGMGFEKRLEERLERLRARHDDGSGNSRR